MEQTETDRASDDYELRQKVEDELYEREYRRWVESLSDHDRQRLVADDSSHQIATSARARI